MHMLMVLPLLLHCIALPSLIQLVIGGSTLEGCHVTF